MTAFETETEPEPDDYDLSHAEWGFESAARQLVEACRANGVEPPAVAVVREADAADELSYWFGLAYERGRKAGCRS